MKPTPGLPNRLFLEASYLLKNHLKSPVGEYWQISLNPNSKRLQSKVPQTDLVDSPRHGEANKGWCTSALVAREKGGVLKKLKGVLPDFA